MQLAIRYKSLLLGRIDSKRVPGVHLSILTQATDDEFHQPLAKRADDSFMAV